MVLDAALLSTKVRIKGKVEQSREWSSALPHTCVVAIEKGAFGLLLSKVAYFTYQMYYLFIYFFYFVVWEKNMKDIERNVIWHSFDNCHIKE